MKKLLLLALLPLAGCVTHQGPSGAERMAADPSQTCLKGVVEQSSSGVLGKKMAFVGSPTLEMLADKSKPTSDEQAAISAFSAARQQCVALGTSYRRANLPGPVMLALEDSASTGTALLAKLYAGDLTYGEYNAARVENGAKAQSRLVDYDRQANQDQAQAKASDDARRQAAGLAVLQNMQTQQAIQAQQPIYQPAPTPALRMPTTTNCQRWGNQVNCISY